MDVLEMVRLLSDGEFDDVDDETIMQWDEFVTPLISKKQFGKLYNHAKALLICHKMSMAGLGSSSLGELGKIKNGFGVSSVSDGGSSISFNNAGVGSLQTNAEYGLTIYGTQFLQIMKMCIIPIRVSGEEVLNGRV